MRGKFYGIGVGVGDPELITMKAVKLLKNVDILVLPEAKKTEGSTAFDIVKDYIGENTQKLFLEFPMINDEDKKKEIRRNNAKKIEELLEKGNNMAFLTIGDPMTYSTYTYILDYLGTEVDVETVPGITSFNSVASRVNVPLVIGDEDLKIISLNSSTNIRKEIEDNDNVVFMKVSRHFNELRTAIKESGNLENIILISNCGKDDEEIHTNLDIVEKIPYFSTLILKKGGIKYE
jgi:precorrin-2/cobalt-factor-2 C20-methyltransferase